MLKISRRTKAGGGLIAGLLGAALALLPAASSASEPLHPSTPKTTTIVLVHGAWADGSSWSSVTEKLQREGYTVDVVANPLRGVKADADYLKDRLSQISGPIVLVGHSYGGMVITSAAAGNANIKALVYVDAYIPDEGDTVGGLTGPDSSLDPDTTLNPVPLKDANGAVYGVDLYVKPDLFPAIFAGGVPPERAAVLAAGQRPVTLAALSEPFAGEPAWKTIPSWDLIGTVDRVIPRAEQEKMAKRAGAHIVRVEAPHLSMVSDPRAVTSLIIAADKQS
ncbi:alpha/beta hydrolase [Promicromonospora sp. NPDC060204]|uniref:alpha/beta hydrolase n=1 Tax=Promicromonospora sp. NPDC060204 TaxID=3347071 RepID=UPI003653F186